MKGTLLGISKQRAPQWLLEIIALLLVRAFLFGRVWLYYSQAQTCTCVNCAHTCVEWNKDVKATCAWCFIYLYFRSELTPHWHHDQRWEMRCFGSRVFQRGLHVRVRWSVKEMDSLHLPRCGWDGGLEGARMGKYKYKKNLRNRERWRYFSFCGAHSDCSPCWAIWFFFSLSRTHALSLSLSLSFSFEWKRKSMANQLDPRTINTPRHQGLLSWSHRLKNL